MSRFLYKILWARVHAKPRPSHELEDDVVLQGHDSTEVDESLRSDQLAILRAEDLVTMPSAPVRSELIQFIECDKKSSAYSELLH